MKTVLQFVVPMALYFLWNRLEEANKKPSPVLLWMGVWFAMMCWEAYDLHPDHALFYSIILLGGAWWSIQRPQLLKK